MGDFVEYSAKTKSEAITKASMDLGVVSEKLEVQVVSEGSSGFFGIGSKPAIIRVRRIEEDKTETEIREIVKNVSASVIKEEEQKEEKEEAKEISKEIKKKEKKQRPIKEEPVRKQKEGSAKPEQKEKAKGKEKPAAKEKPEVKPAVSAETETAEVMDRDDFDKDYFQKPPVEKKPRERRNPERRKGGRKDRTVKDNVQEAKAETEPNAPEGAESPEKEEQPVHVSRPVKILTDPEQIAKVEEAAKKFLIDVFACMDLGEVTVTSEYNAEEGCLDVDFEGEDMGVLIGKRGQTLDSLQYLTSLVVNKSMDDYVRVKLDTEDYRRRRKETLENLARGIAYKVKKTRRPVVLEPMNPYERRIIHSALQSNKYVETMSEGEEPYRHVVVKMKRYYKD